MGRRLETFVYCATACAALAVLTGCRTFNAPAPPSFAEKDETLSKPMRPPTEKRERPWWELPTFFDSRAEEIERSLGY